MSKKISSCLGAPHYILEKKGRMSLLRLTHLLYHCQIHSVGFGKIPLFEDSIYAVRANCLLTIDPIENFGKFFLKYSDLPGSASNVLNISQKIGIDKVLSPFWYGNWDLQALCDLLRNDLAWLTARSRCKEPYERIFITHRAMREGYDLSFRSDCVLKDKVRKLQKIIERGIIDD